MHHRWMGGRSIQAVAGAHGSFLALCLFFRVTPPVRLGRPAPLSHRAACDVWRLLLPADELQGLGKGVSMAVVVRKPAAVGATTATNTAAAAAATAAAAAGVGLGRARGHPRARPLLLPLLMGRHHLPPDLLPIRLRPVAKAITTGGRRQSMAARCSLGGRSSRRAEGGRRLRDGPVLPMLPIRWRHFDLGALDHARRPAEWVDRPGGGNGPG